MQKCTQHWAVVCARFAASNGGIVLRSVKNEEHFAGAPADQILGMKAPHRT